MHETVKQLCLLLKEQIDVPIFDYTIPDGFSSTCVVVREDSYNVETDEGEYHVNVYVPNKLRIFGNMSDNSYPDIEGIDVLGEQVLTVCNDFWQDRYNGWIHTRKFIKEGSMHYLNICLTIQFF